MRDHETIEELLWARALGAIEPDDERRLDAEMGAHGDCDECRRLERDAAEVAGRLALSLDPVAVPPGLEERTVAVATPTPRVATAAPPHTRTAPQWWRAVAAVAAAIVLFAGGWLVGREAEPETVLLDGRVVSFDATGGGTLSLVYRPDEPGVYVVGSRLPAPAPGRTYELWFFRGDTPVRAGCFLPADGVVLQRVEVSIEDEYTDAAVTEEPNACPAAPTRTPVFTAPL